MDCQDCGKPIRVVITETRREEYEVDENRETNLWSEPIRSNYEIDDYFAVCQCVVCPYTVKYCDDEEEDVYRVSLTVVTSAACR